MVRSYVVVSCVLITLGSMLFLAEMRHQLNGADEQRQLAVFWKKRVAVEQLNKALIHDRFADFKQEVALLIPDAYSDQQRVEDKNKLRDLASVIPHEKLKIQLGVTADRLLKEGKDSVIARDYDKGIKSLQKLIDTYPDSHHNVEAHYLIMEAYFNMHKTDQALKLIDAMVELFPENRLTGFALLKLGGIYERQSRHEEALYTYRIILSSFSDKNLIAEANKGVKLLEL